VPSRRGKCCPVAFVSSRWPDHHGVEIPTVSTDALDYGHYYALDTRSSAISEVLSANENLDRPEHGEHYPGLVHVVHIFSKDGWIFQHFPNHLKPVFNLMVCVLLMSVLVQCPNFPRSQFRMTVLQSFSPILVGRLSRSVCYLRSAVLLSAVRPVRMPLRSVATVWQRAQASVVPSHIPQS